MRRSKTFFGRTSRFEFLECRTVLNGTVTVTGAVELLSLVGDNRANSIAIHQIGGNLMTGATILLQGIGTKIKTPSGALVNSFTATGITDITANLNGGNDVANLYNIALTGEIDIDMGTGNDSLSMNNVHLTEEHLSIQLGDGTKVASLLNVSVQYLNFSGGTGQKVVTLDKVNCFDTSVSPNFTVSLGGGTRSVLTAIDCTGSGSFEDDGTNGSISGFGNHFDAQSIIGFRFRFGDLQHDTA